MLCLFLIRALAISCVIWSIHALNNDKDRAKSRGAIVTLVSGTNSGGYASGALALGQSIIDVGSKLDLVVMVTKGAGAAAVPK